MRKSRFSLRCAVTKASGPIERFLVVLGVSRDDGTYLGLQAAETVIRSHDTQVVYGKPTEVSALDAGGIEVAGEITDA